MDSKNNCGKGETQIKVEILYPNEDVALRKSFDESTKFCFSITPGTE